MIPSYVVNLDELAQSTIDGLKLNFKPDRGDLKGYLSWSGFLCSDLEVQKQIYSEGVIKHIKINNFSGEETSFSCYVDDTKLFDMLLPPIEKNIYLDVPGVNFIRRGQTLILKTNKPNAFFSFEVGVLKTYKKGGIFNE